MSGGEVTGSQPVVLPIEVGQPTVVRPREPADTSVLQQLGDYVILQKIGEGGMGSVYLAEDTRLHRKVAIKTMRPEFAANPADRHRFLREARAAAAVESDYIVPIWQTGEATDGTPYIAMPFLQGEMLDARLKRESVAPLGVLLKVAREVAEGLSAAHAKGLIHRDIKPANVWVEGDPSAREIARQVRRCKVLDFGLARSAGKEEVQITASGAILGTPAYMAPEQARGARVDHRADLFSLGVMLYRMATGRLPFNGQNPMAVLIALTTETPAPSRTLNPNLPPAVADLIDRLLSKDVAARPQSAAEVVSAVRQIVKEIKAQQTAVASSSIGSAPKVLPEALPAWDLIEQSVVNGPPAPLALPEEDDATERELEILRTARMSAKRAKRNRTWWLAAGGALTLVVVAAVVIRIATSAGTLVVEINDPEVEARVKNGKLVLVGADGKDRYTITAAEQNKTIAAGSYTIRVEGADGLALDTREFTLKKGGLVTVRVTLDPKAVVRKGAAGPPDWLAAEYVLRMGGGLGINGNESELKTSKDLPGKAFQLTSVNLSYSKTAGDDDLAVFRECKNLANLDLHGSNVSDIGVAHFGNNRQLTAIDINNTWVGDAGLAAFKNCTKLTRLNLANTRVSNVGLAYFRDCKLLERLDLYGAPVGDDGLIQIVSCPRLYYLDVRKTHVTANCVANLRKALPECRIEWDGGTIQPRP